MNRDESQKELMAVQWLERSLVVSNLFYCSGFVWLQITK